MIKQLFKRKETTPDLPRPLPPGTPAPDFTLPATTGEPVSLSDLSGQPVVLAFYPADNSSVCSNQLALYNEALHLFHQHDAHILGISIDDMASHRTFAQSLKLGFPLLSDADPHGAVSRAYGVYGEHANSSERALFVIDAVGIIRWSYVSPRGINPGANGILEALESLAPGD